MNWQELLLMGGYAPYVWGSYAVTLAAMGGEVYLLLRRRRADALSFVAAQPRREHSHETTP